MYTLSVAKGLNRNWHSDVGYDVITITICAIKGSNDRCRNNYNFKRNERTLSVSSIAYRENSFN